VYVSGTSSGAHLGAVAAATEWEGDGLPRDIVKGYTLCSGMYDLRGPRLSKRSSYVKFTDEMEAALSPQRHLERISAPMVLLYGSHETPEFKRQTQEFAAALKAAGKGVELVYAEGYNHFELSDTLANPYGPAGRAVLAQMGLAATLREAPAARGVPSPT
jgi:arylformamidase